MGLFASPLVQGTPPRGTRNSPELAHSHLSKVGAFTDLRTCRTSFRELLLSAKHARRVASLHSTTATSMTRGSGCFAGNVQHHTQPQQLQSDRRYRPTHCIREELGKGSSWHRRSQAPADRWVKQPKGSHHQVYISSQGSQRTHGPRMPMPRMPSLNNRSPSYRLSSRRPMARPSPKRLAPLLAKRTSKQSTSGTSSRSLTETSRCWKLPPISSDRTKSCSTLAKSKN